MLNHSCQKLFLGHSFHKIVRFYIFVLEEGYSKTGMEVTGVSLCVILVSSYLVHELPLHCCMRRLYV